MLFPENCSKRTYLCTTLCKKSKWGLFFDACEGLLLCIVTLIKFNCNYGTGV